MIIGLRGKSLQGSNQRQAREKGRLSASGFYGGTAEGRNCHLWAHQHSHIREDPPEPLGGRGKGLCTCPGSTCAMAVPDVTGESGREMPQHPLRANIAHTWPQNMPLQGQNGMALPAFLTPIQRGSSHPHTQITTELYRACAGQSTALL